MHCEHNNKHRTIHLAFFFKDFAHWIRSSCVGLNVAGYTTARYLKDCGIDTVVYPVRHNIDIVHSIDKYNENHDEPLTHVVISAPWLSVYDLDKLLHHFPYIKFIILSHSNVGFLQADPNAVRIYRKYVELSKIHRNLKIGGNCIQFAEWFKTVYREHCVCLPNLYPAPYIKSKIWDRQAPLKIGAFGAIRPEKNFMTAAAAAMVIQAKLNVHTELHMSTGGDGCKSTTLPAIEQMVENVSDVNLIRHNWDTWDKFIQLVAQMDLMVQVSYTESFNMVTADGISVGVPSVVSPVIFWAPNTWKANPDSALEVAEVGIKLLTVDQGYKGAKALRQHNEKSLDCWLDYLKS